MDTLEKQIRTYIAQNILFTGNEYPYTDDISFLDQGVVDSMNVLELVNFVEERYGLRVEDRDIVPDNFDSVARLAAYVRNKQQAA
jgi:acyl carrier protein